MVKKSGMKTFGALKEEVGKSLNDWGFIVFLILTMLLAPLVVMSIMGSTFQEVVSDLNVIVVDSNSSEYSEAVIRSINYSEYFNIVQFEGNLDMATDRVGRDVVAVFYIPEDFGDRLSNAEEGELTLYLDSSDFIIFNFIEAKSEEVLENSVEGIIQIIVEGLEIEKSDKAAINLEVKNLADLLYLKINKVEDSLDDVEIHSAISGLDDLEEDVDVLGSSCEECSVSSINAQINSIRDNLYDYKKYISKAETSLDEGKGVSSKIREEIDNLKLDLKTLKNEFLSHPIEVDKKYVFGDTNYFEYLLPAIISASLFFVVFTLTVLNRIRKKKEKARKWLVRLNLLLIKSLFYIFIGTLELVYILVLAKTAFNANVSLVSLPIFVVLFLLAISSLGLGLVFSFIFRTEKETTLLFPLVIIPLVLISETFSSLEILPKIFGTLAKVSPLYYANLALREIMLKGSDLYDLLSPVGALITYSIISVTVGLIIFLFRKK